MGKKAEWTRRREEGREGRVTPLILCCGATQDGTLGTLLGATLTLGFLPGLANLNLYFVRVYQKDHIGDALQGGQLPIIWGLQVKPLQHPGHEEEECLAGHVLPYAGAGSCSEGQVAGGWRDELAPCGVQEALCGHGERIRQGPGPE